MKISQLAAVSGEAVSTIKFYIRVGLLPPGQVIAKNQADYDESHVERLSLIATLQHELGLNIEQVAEALAATAPHPGPVSRARRERGRSAPERISPAEQGLARREVEATMRDLGWLVDAGDPAFLQVVRSVAVLSRVLSRTNPRDYLLRLAQAMSELALQEIDHERGLTAGDAPNDSNFVLQTVAFEPLLVGLRRMARSQRLAQVRLMEEAEKAGSRPRNRGSPGGGSGRPPTGPSAKRGMLPWSVKAKR